MTKLVTRVRKTKLANIKVRSVKVFNDMKVTEHCSNDKEQKNLWKEVNNGN